MMRTAIPFHVTDIAALARSLEHQLAGADTPPGHLSVMNMLARGAGFRNFQHLRAAAGAAVRLEEGPVTPMADTARVAEALRHFDKAAAMQRWPARTAVQKLCVWVLWARLPARVSMTEREISAALNALHLFGDAAILRRTMVEIGIVTRTEGGTAYARVEQRPPPEAQALIRHLGRAMAETGC